MSIDLNVLKDLDRYDAFLSLEAMKKVLLTTILLFFYRYGVITIWVCQIIGSVALYLPNSCANAHRLIPQGLVMALESILSFRRPSYV